ncbi:MAG: calcium-binding protein [Kofleriaceae bacterium]
MRWLAVLMISACAVEDEASIDELVDAAQLAGRDPCADPQIRARANVDRVNGRFVGTNARDVIIGTPGDDIIFGNGGDDLICGLDGDDFIDGGDGRDLIFAGPGKDIVHGRGGSDTIWGGPGPDVLFGDILDDKLHGEDGNDVLIGGHGTDLLDGGPDNDFLRGDTGNDEFRGGAGNDTASFATALPPGQPDNLTTGIHIVGNDADGDGGNEPLEGIERIIGSSFVDDIRGTVTAAAPLNQVFLVEDAADVGVVVLGTPGNDQLQIFGSADNVRVVANHAITAGAGCTAIDATSVRCAIAGKPFHFITAWADDGDDLVELFGEFPRELEAHISGGEGNDHLIGGDEADVLFTGTSGTDHLEGRGGDDALLGESHHTAAFANDDRPPASRYTDGADILDGGEGNDQLVVDYVCGGHRYIGGPGRDIAGFARSGKHPIHAQLGGPAAFKSDWWGFAANVDLCPAKADWTSFRTGIAADLEVLEASDGPDHLWGDDRANVVWGRGGGDHIFGLDGDDELLGADGTDVIDGGRGHNDISYGNQRL